jgi:hypothetical protein
MNRSGIVGVFNLIFYAKPNFVQVSFSVCNILRQRVHAKLSRSLVNSLIV